MSDIVERLRERANDPGARAKPYNLLLDAAEAIEDRDRTIQHLRDELASARAIIANLAGDDEEKPRYTTKRLRHEVDRARAEAFERAAQIAKNWLEAWGIDLQETCDAYRDAVTSGRFAGRRISPDVAKVYARQFKERSDAVYDCGELIAAAIRAEATREGSEG